MILESDWLRVPSDKIWYLLEIKTQFQSRNKNIARSDDIEHIENRNVQLVIKNKNNLKLIRYKFYYRKIVNKLFNF